MRKVPSRLKVTWLAILAFWPLVIMFLLWIPVQFKSVGRALPLWAAKWFLVLLPLGVLVGLVCFVVDAFTNRSVPPDKRSLWVALLFFANPFAQPVCFWHYVRGSRPETQGQLS